MVLKIQILNHGIRLETTNGTYFRPENNKVRVFSLFVKCIKSVDKKHMHLAQNTHL